MRRKGMTWILRVEGKEGFGFLDILDRLQIF